ncbi:hypothetical protein [Sphingomonas sp. ABOLE]|uniref:hypothetical protein n=1 Tax=Sphingomonas sp. ABOLE TaxID=1985878 RepID=UPI001F49DA99|nr:hypothetical protein [Sphingomonas sp. ABOLE]
MQQHPSLNDPDVLQVVDDFRSDVLAIRDITRPLVGMPFDDPRRATIGAQVQQHMDGIDLRAGRLGISGLVLFELINMALDAERVVGDGPWFVSLFPNKVCATAHGVIDYRFTDPVQAASFLGSCRRDGGRVLSNVQAAA